MRKSPSAIDSRVTYRAIRSSASCTWPWRKEYRACSRLGTGRLYKDIQSARGMASGGQSRSPYGRLAALGADDVIRKLDERSQYVPVNPGDAFFAIVVLSAVVERGRPAGRSHATQRGFERATIALATSGVVLTAATVILAIVAL